MNLEKIKVLIANGAGVNAKNNEGKTPLDVVREHYIDKAKIDYFTNDILGIK